MKRRELPHPGLRRTAEMFAETELALNTRHSCWPRMIVNLKTARKLGVAIPPTILVRADEVIE